GGQRGRLAGAGRPRDQDQPLVQHRRLLEDGWQAQLVGGEDLGRDLAEDRAAAVLLHEVVGAEPRDVGDLVTEVDVARLLEGLDFLLGRDLVQHLPEEFVVQGVVLHPLQLAVHAPDRRVGGPDTMCRSDALVSNISLKKASSLAMRRAPSTEEAPSLAEAPVWTFGGVAED